MPNAPSPAALLTKPHQGVGARILRRVGGAVQGVIANGIALTARLRRSAAPQPSRTAPAPPPPRSKRAPRPPHAATPPRPARTGWFARWFGRKPPRAASRARTPRSRRGDAPFTPDAYPGLPPDVRDFLNTPVKDCDPDLLRFVLSVLVRHIADSLPPELGMDAKALFASLCDRLGAPSGEAPPAAAPAEPPPAPNQAQADNATAAPVPHTAGRPRPALRPPCGRRRASRHHRRIPAAPPPLPPRRLWYAACAGPP